MKLWRKLARKDPDTGKRDGREIAYQLRMSDMMSKQSKKTYPLLETLFNKAGMSYVLTKKQQDALKDMIEKQNSTQTEEPLNETV